MLAIISDTHHSDGSTSANPNPESFGILRQDILHHARAKKVEEVHLVLLGDIFDLVRTDWWFKPDNVPPERRPWNGDLDPQTGMNRDLQDVERQFAAVLGAVLEHRSTRAFLRALNGIAKARPAGQARITYVIGNHDRVLHNFPRLQEQIKDRLEGWTVEFTDVFQSSDYGVYARHGHEWDEHCNARLLLQKVLRKDRKWDPLDPGIHRVMAIGEVITAELMSGLVHRVRQTGNATLVETIKGVDNLRPATDVFQWLQWQTRGRNLATEERKHLCQALIDSISGVVDASLGKLWDKIQTDLLATGDIVDRLQFVRTTLRIRGLDGLRDCVRLFVTLSRFKDTVLPDKDENYEGARAEFARLAPQPQFVVHGHTHRARHDYFTAQLEGRVQMYINTGTYLPLIQRTDDSTGFARSHQMTMVFLFKDGEDKRGKAKPGPTLYLWNGVQRKDYLPDHW